MAGDLSACYGVDTAAVVFSEGSRAFASCIPSVDAVLRRLIDGEEPLYGDEALDLGYLASRRQELTDAEALVAAEKARLKAFGTKVMRRWGRRRGGRPTRGRSQRRSCRSSRVRSGRRSRRTFVNQPCNPGVRLLLLSLFVVLELGRDRPVLCFHGRS